MATLRERCEQNRLALRRIEVRMNRANDRLAADETMTFEEHDEEESRAILGVQRLLGDVPGFFVDSDPRGAALKVTPDAAKGLKTDWGGYGLLAPDR